MEQVANGQSSVVLTTEEILAWNRAMKTGDLYRITLYINPAVGEYAKSYLINTAVREVPPAISAPPNQHFGNLPLAIPAISPTLPNTERFLEDTSSSDDDDTEPELTTAARISPPPVPMASDFVTDSIHVSSSKKRSNKRTTSSDDQKHRLNRNKPRSNK
jgi:hypothetical protein